MKAQHIHRFQRVNLGKETYDRKTKTYKKEKYIVFRCIKPGCPHYIRQRLLLNRVAECNICGEPFIISKQAVLMAKPHCANCTKRKPSTIAKLKAAEEAMKLLGLIESVEDKLNKVDE